MGKNCPQCGEPVKELWTVCHNCLSNLDGYTLYLSEKDLAEFCEAICELEFTYNHPENDGYFDFFMLFKNLFDAMSFYEYKNESITRVAEFYLYLLLFFQSRKELIRSEHLSGRMELVLESVRRPLVEQDIFSQIDEIKAMQTLPQITEKEAREQHLKSQIWWLGTTINITLRKTEIGLIPTNHPLLRGMFDLFALLRKGVYGSQGIESIKSPFKEFEQEWKARSSPYEKERDMYPLLANMRHSLKTVSDILTE